MRFSALTKAMKLFAFLAEPLLLSNCSHYITCFLICTYKIQKKFKILKIQQRKEPLAQPTLSKKPPAESTQKRKNPYPGLLFYSRGIVRVRRSQRTVRAHVPRSKRGSGSGTNPSVTKGRSGSDRTAACSSAFETARRNDLSFFASPCRIEL